MNTAIKAADGLPRLRCVRRVLEPVGAEPESAFWRGIEPVELRENVGGGAPAQATRVRTAWDEREWRVLFEAEDARPWATLTRRDGPLWTEEVMEVFFDPVGDLESYFEVEINPLGAVTDLVLRRTLSGWRKDFAWDVGGLTSAAQLTATGWAAELAIPFETLGASMRPEPGRSSWRVNFLRVDMPGGPGTPQDLSAWSPTRLRNFHRAEVFGEVEFVD